MTIISPTLHTAMLASLEKVINKTLKLDPATQNRLSALQHHVFLLHCTEPDISVYLIPGDGEVRLCGVFEGEADTKLTGSASEYSKLFAAEDPASALINGELELIGNSQALIELQKILTDLDIDWEAPLAQHFGDVIGHQMGQGIRAGFNFGRQAFKGLSRQFKEFITEESELVPPKPQTERFFREVDQLATRTERLEARLQKLRQSLQNR